MQFSLRYDEEIWELTDHEKEVMILMIHREITAKFRMVPIDHNGVWSFVYFKFRLLTREVKASILAQPCYPVTRQHTRGCQFWRRHCNLITDAETRCKDLLLPPANVVCEGYVFTGVCLSTGGGTIPACIAGGIPACLAAGLGGIPACLAGFQAHTQGGSLGESGQVESPGLYPRWKLRGIWSRSTPKGKV